MRDFHSRKRCWLKVYSFVLCSLWRVSVRLKSVCFCKLIKIDFSTFSSLFSLTLHCFVWKLNRMWIFLELSVLLYFLFFSLFLSSVLLLIQTERTIHYKSLFYNEKHSFRSSRVKAHTAERLYFLFIIRLYQVGWKTKKIWMGWKTGEKLYRKSSRYQPSQSQAGKKRANEQA